MSALALTLEASLDNAMKEVEAVITDPIASREEHIIAWSSLSIVASPLLLKGSPWEGGIAGPGEAWRKLEAGVLVSVDDALLEATVATIGDANLPLKTRIEALRVAAVIAQFHSAAGRMTRQDPSGNEISRNHLAILGQQHGIHGGPAQASVLVSLASPEALNSYLSIVAAAGDARAHDFSSLARIYGDNGYTRDPVAVANFDYEGQLSLMHSDRPLDAPWEARILVAKTLSSLTLDNAANKWAICSNVPLLELAVRSINDAPFVQFRGQAA